MGHPTRCNPITPTFAECIFPHRKFPAHWLLSIRTVPGGVRFQMLRACSRMLILFQPTDPTSNGSMRTVWQSMRHLTVMLTSSSLRLTYISSLTESLGSQPCRRKARWLHTCSIASLRERVRQLSCITMSRCVSRTPAFYLLG